MGGEPESTDNRQTSLLRRLAVNLVLVAVSVGIAFAIAELVLTVYEERLYMSAFIDPYLPETDDSVMCVDLDDPTRFERFAWDEDGNNIIHIRSGNRRLVYELRPSSWVSTQVQTNAHGFRDGEATLEKPEKVYRICAVGDSLTFGWLLKQEEIYTEVLERLLNEKPDGLEYQVLNMAVDGYNADQEAELIRTRVFDFEPDLLIIGYCANDDQVGADAGLWRHFSRGKLRVLDMVRLRLMQMRENASPKSMIERSYEEIAALCKERNLPLLVITFPHRHDAYKHVEEQKELCERLGMMVVDPTPAFTEVGLERLLPDEVHPTAEGHRIAAKQVYRYLWEHVL